MTSNRIKLCIPDILEVEVESNQKNFEDLKKEALELFEHVKKCRVKSEPCSTDVV